MFDLQVIQNPYYNLNEHEDMDYIEELQQRKKPLAFGKYRGFSLNEIEDENYLSWLFSQDWFNIFDDKHFQRLS